MDFGSRLIIDIVCLFLMTLFIIRLSEKKKAKTKRKQRMFFLLVVLIATMGLIDIFVGIAINKAEAFYISLNWASHALYYFLILCVCYIWLLYVLDALKYSRKKKYIIAIIAFIPFIVVSVLIMLNNVTHWFFDVDVNGVYTLGKYNFIYSYTCVLYPIVSGTLTVARLIKLNSKNAKVFLYPLSTFPIVSLTCGIIQIIFPDYSVTHIGIMLSAILFYDFSQLVLLKLDKLTGLFNRSAFEIFRENFLNKEYRDLTIVMFDINDFKKINDTYGHAVGDKVLRIVGDAVKETLDEIEADAKAYRIGGDEIIICGRKLGKSLVEKLYQDIDKHIDICCNNENFEHTISLSKGYAIGLVKTDKEFIAVFDEADRVMYEYKNNWKTKVNL